MSEIVKRLYEKKIAPGTFQSAIILSVAIVMALMGEKMGACMLVLGFEVGISCINRN